MILCFSGTGNSRYVANEIAKVTGETVIDLNAKIKNNDTSDIACDDFVTIVAPTYAWRLPKIVSDWIVTTNLVGAKRAFFVMTCGGEIADAMSHNYALCKEKGLEYMGTAPVIMPENYIAMFNAPDEVEAKKIITRADQVIAILANKIKYRDQFPSNSSSLKDKFLSGFVNEMFYKMFVKAEAFKTDSKCVGCGLCKTLCPLNNISIVDNKPVWGENCTHCMACICHCPTCAIEYGRKSVGKPRYHID